MRILSEIELKNAREKLGLLQASYAKTESEPTTDEELRELELESLGRLIKQLKKKSFDPKPILLQAEGSFRMKDRGDPMELKTDAEVAHTRVLLKEFQDRYDQLRAEQTETPRIKELTLWSLKKTINQFIEDIARYESRLHEV